MLTCEIYFLVFSETTKTIFCVVQLITYFVSLILPVKDKDRAERGGPKGVSVNGKKLPSVTMAFFYGL